MQATGGTAIASKKVPLWLLWGSIALAGYAADLASKIAAMAYLDPQNPPVLLGGLLRLQLVQNPGAAFSLASGMTVALSVFAMVAFVAVLVYAVRRVRKPSHAIAAGLLLAGIAGNVTDRLFRAPGPLRGHVVDMFQLPHFAIFNIADVCITSAAVLIVVLALKGDK